LPKAAETNPAFDRNALLDAFDQIDRGLASPWFTATSPSPAMREYLTFCSPAEFASRNIFTEERPLRRARSPQPAGN
jgi:hypothetical protein